MKVIFQVDDGTIPPTPKLLVAAGIPREILCAQDIRVDPRDQHLFVVGPIKDANPSAFWQPVVGSPQKIVLELLHTRLFKTKYLAALGVHPRHDVPNGAVLARRIDALKNN